MHRLPSRLLRALSTTRGNSTPSIAPSDDSVLDASVVLHVYLSSSAIGTVIFNVSVILNNIVYSIVYMASLSF